MVEGCSYQGVFVIMAFPHPIALLVLHSLIKGALAGTTVPDTPAEQAA